MEGSRRLALTTIHVAVHSNQIRQLIAEKISFELREAARAAANDLILAASMALALVTSGLSICRTSVRTLLPCTAASQK